MMRFEVRNEPEDVPAPASAQTRSGAVQSVEAALRLLELLAQTAGPVRVSDLASRLELTKPRVCRHLATLEGMGLARRAGRTGYTFGPRLTQMAHCVLRERTLSELAQPLLVALRDETGQTVTLSAPTEDGAVVLNCIESEQATSIRVRPGTVLRYPYSPAARLAMAMRASNIGSLPDLAAAQQARQRWQDTGVDYEIDTQHTGLGGVAAPVIAGEQLLGLVSLVVPSRLLMPQPPQALVAALLRAVTAIQKSASA
jgi:DNA-binding IclR family transcriptional regulator